MAERILGPTGSRRRRRLGLWIPLIALVALLIPGLVLGINLPSTGTSGTSNGAAFEVDGDKQSSAAGALDWSAGSAGSGVITATRSSSGNCSQTNSQVLGSPTTVGGGVLVCDGSVGTDKPLDNKDINAFVQGQHEEESPDKAVPAGSTTVKWQIEAASSPKKTDLAEVMAYAKAGDSVFDGDTAIDDLFFVFDATRLDINGDFHVDFELNQQSRTNCGDADAGSFCQPRQAGDIIVSFDSDGTDLLTSVYQYVTTGAPNCATTSAGIGVPPGCYVQIPTPPTGPGGGVPFFAVFNGSEISSPPWQSVGCDPVTGDNKPGCKLRSKMPAGGDMEGYIDLTAFLPNFNPCPGFGQLNPKSRSSSGINSSLQDDAGAIPFNVSICKSLLIRKEGKDASTTATNDLLGGATFTITPNPLTGSATGLDITDNGANDENSTPGLVCVKASSDGPFTIVEKTAPANYLKDSTSDTGNTPANADCATRSTSPGSENAKFVNTPLSSIQVKFTSLAGAGKTVAQIVCKQGTTVVPAVSENNDPDNETTPDRDDTDETFGNGTTGLVDAVYTCTIDIDP